MYLQATIAGRSAFLLSNIFLHPFVEFVVLGSVRGVSLRRDGR
jgi:hypothetical protein